ncbi:hypothetical protein M5C72_08530 [Companilactobacillus allii]|uniref:Uncharacterized protein n=1 Tax=Companilactobacillus allii TaxID=1847728 RepID=A0A1P8Q5J7_9LACO|nr:hypothetical protein [Companilactobacillus allii]APX73126.1 hypothetical protein BTM29_11430 [Companilactobacillus allii]USQ67928.1 hypothetical protein M5C72_08530 [Companilactobacillus allii]
MTKEEINKLKEFSKSFHKIMKLIRENDEVEEALAFKLLDDYDGEDIDVHMDFVFDLVNKLDDVVNNLDQDNQPKDTE